MRASEPAHAVPREVHSNELVAQKRGWFELVLGRGECTDEARGAASAAGAAEACGNDRHPDLAGEPVVDRGAEDDLRLVRRGLADDLRRLVHLEQRQVVATIDDRLTGQVWVTVIATGLGGTGRRSGTPSLVRALTAPEDELEPPSFLRN